MGLVVRQERGIKIGEWNLDRIRRCEDGRTMGMVEQHFRLSS
jgi:hypothetical protein